LVKIVVPNLISSDMLGEVLPSFKFIFDKV
jgi:hypothetical protein